MHAVCTNALIIMTTSSSSNWEDNVHQLYWNEICHECIARDSPKWLCTVQWNTCTLLSCG